MRTLIAVLATLLVVFSGVGVAAGVSPGEAGAFAAGVGGYDEEAGCAVGGAVGGTAGFVAGAVATAGPGAGPTAVGGLSGGCAVGA